MKGTIFSILRKLTEGSSNRWRVLLIIAVYLLVIGVSTVGFTWQKRESILFGLSGMIFLAGGAVMMFFFMIHRFQLQAKELRELKDKVRGTDVRDLEEADGIRQVKAELEFEQNRYRPFFLQCLQLEKLPFYGDLTWTFQPSINVLLGRNGYGKTHVMRAIVSLLQKDSEQSKTFFPDSGEGCSAKLFLESNNEEVIIHRTSRRFEESIGKVPVLAIPDSRFVNRSVIQVSQSRVDTRKLREVGAHDFLYQEPYESRIQTFLYELCTEYLEHGKTFDRPIFRLIENVVQQLTENTFSFHKIKLLESAAFEIKVLTEGNTDKAIPIQYASQGTLSIMTMFGLIYQYLKSVHGDRVSENELSSQRAIVFIDELDAHLHPTWQQRIVRLLRDRFPNIQFVITAHSPLVVAGCLKKEVAVLRPKADGGFTVEQFAGDFIGCHPEEIYDKVFQVEEGDETYRYYTALYPFRDKISAQLEELASKERLSADEEQRRRDLQEKLYYLEKVRSRESDRNQLKELQRENRKLRRQLQRFKEK